eukprot:g1572.t1
MKKFSNEPRVVELHKKLECANRDLNAIKRAKSRIKKQLTDATVKSGLLRSLLELRREKLENKIQKNIEIQTSALTVLQTNHAALEEKWGESVRENHRLKLVSDQTANFLFNLQKRYELQIEEYIKVKKDCETIQLLLGKVSSQKRIFLENLFEKLNSTGNAYKEEALESANDFKIALACAHAQKTLLAKAKDCNYDIEHHFKVSENSATILPIQKKIDDECAQLIQQFLVLRKETTGTHVYLKEEMSKLVAQIIRFRLETDLASVERRKAEVASTHLILREELDALENHLKKLKAARQVFERNYCWAKAILSDLFSAGHQDEPVSGTSSSYVETSFPLKMMQRLHSQSSDLNETLQNAYHAHKEVLKGRASSFVSSSEGEEDKYILTPLPSPTSQQVLLGDSKNVVEEMSSIVNAKSSLSMEAIATEMQLKGFPTVLIGAYRESGTAKAIASTASAIATYGPRLERFEILRQKASQPLALTLQESNHPTCEQLRIDMKNNGFSLNEIDIFLTGGAAALANRKKEDLQQRLAALEGDKNDDGDGYLQERLQNIIAAEQEEDDNDSKDVI